MPDTLPENLSLDLAPSVPLDLILVEPGYFIMGDATGFDWAGETHEHLVHITQPFYIGKYPITQAQWQAVMQDNHQSGFPGPQRPVETVSWIEIVEGKQDDNGAPAFLPRLNAILSAKRPELFATRQFNLPTEAQWEYAAKGGPRYTCEELEEKKAAERYATYAGSDRLESCGWFEDNSHDETKPVGLKAPNELGLYDMAGNIREWCLDWFDSDEYKERKEPVTKDPVGPDSGGYRVLRGGSSWRNAWDCRVADRSGNHPTDRDVGIGFRVVLSPSSGSGAAG